MPNEPNFEGHQPRSCGEHRTVGPHRAWCHDCTEWCYPRLEAGCRGCQDGQAAHGPEEYLAPSNLVEHIDPDRPYDGQAHTVHGERGRQEVHGITMRDVLDCFIRACYDSSGLPIEEWPGSVYDLPWDEMDIIAVAQNLTCNIERRMGIFPNRPEPADLAETTASAKVLFDALSRRQQEVVRLLLMGHRLPTVARILNLAPSTVRTYASSAYRRLGITSQSQLFALLRPGQPAGL